MKISLSGRSAIVTGASKGIGFAIAKRFAESGADVAIVARGREPLDAAVTEIKTVTNAHVIGVQGDVAKAEEEKSRRNTIRACGPIWKGCWTPKAIR